ncbi:MAG: TonB family protein [bacterium]
MDKFITNDIKNRYPFFIKSSLLTTLVMCIILFAFAPKLKNNPYQMKAKKDVVVMEKLPEQIQKINEPKEIEKPQLPKKIVETTKESEVTKNIDLTTTFETENMQDDYEGEIFRIYEKAPQLAQRIDPDYPQMARQLGIEGTVFLEIIVEKDGTVSSVRVLKSVHPLLDESATAAAYKLLFTPAMTRDLPIRCYVTYPITFRLTK